MIRKMVKNWTPVHPPFMDKTDRFKRGIVDRWSKEQKAFLRKYYADSEDYLLAQRLNCSDRDVVREARVMKLKKSQEFALWQGRDPNYREPGCPVGFHWETDKEREIRIAQEQKVDKDAAWSYAREYDFCTSEEKMDVAKVIYDAIQWARTHCYDYQGKLYI